MSGAERPDAGAISSAELLDRIRVEAQHRLDAGSRLPPPQGLPPWDGDRVDGSDAFPWRSPREGVPVSLRGFALAVNDFLELRPERRFVVRCFHALLGRDPSSEELERWARRVRSDWHRVPVLFAIRYSRGGRAAGVRIRVRWLRLVRDGAAHAVQVVRSRWRRR